MPVRVDYIFDILRVKTKHMNRVDNKIKRVCISGVDKNKTVACINKMRASLIGSDIIKIADHFKRAHFALIAIEFFSWKHFSSTFQKFSCYLYIRGRLSYN